MNDIVYAQLKSDDPIVVISGLLAISEDIKDRDISGNYANTIYHVIIPHLSHNNYKIRAIAFSIAETIFVKNCEDLTDVSISLPILIFSLSSVNKSIVKSADTCLRVIFEIFDVSLWWEAVEENILYSKSLSIRVHLLELLIGFGSIIPLEPIFKLLDDQRKEIRDLAEEVLLEADEEVVKNMMKNSKISFNIYQRLYKTFVSKELKPKREFRAESNERKIFSQRRQSRPTKKVEFSDINGKDHRQNENSPSKNNRTDTLFFSDLSDNSRRTNRTNLSQRTNNTNATQRTHGSRASRITDRTNRTNISGASGNRMRSSSIRRSNSGENGIKISASQPERLKYQNNKNVGTISQKSMKNSPLSLRDMSNMSWLERVTFLEHFQSLFDCNYQFNSSPSEIAQCLLSAAFPLHVKVSPILAKILAKVCYQYPEILHNYLFDITKFFLHAIRPPSTLSKENGAQDLLDAILHESSPDELIDTCLLVKKENQRPFLIENIVLLIYKKRPDYKLSSITIKNILCYLISSPIMTETQQKLLLLLSQKEKNEVIKFYNNQTKENRKILMHFIPREDLRKCKNNTKPKEIETIVNTQNQTKLKFTIEQEMKKGPKANFKKLALSLQGYHFENIDSFNETFSTFLQFLARIPDTMIKANSVTLCDLCNSAFNTVQVFNIFSPPIVRPQIIKGFSIFVWHCPMTILNNGTGYYQKLYHIFQDADSEERRQIVSITMAIEKVTRSPFVQLEEMISPHRALVQKLMNQFDVVEA